MKKLYQARYHSYICPFHEYKYIGVGGNSERHSEIDLMIRISAHSNICIHTYNWCWTALGAILSHFGPFGGYLTPFSPPLRPPYIWSIDQISWNGPWWIALTGKGSINKNKITRETHQQYMSTNQKLPLSFTSLSSLTPIRSVNQADMTPCGFTSLLLDCSTDGVSACFYWSSHIASPDEPLCGSDFITVVVISSQSFGI